METPYTGRAIINELYNGVDIIVPAKKNWFIVVFLSFWICGWLVGEISVIREVTGVSGDGSSNGFLSFWLCGWTIGGIMAIRTWWWNVAGKEIINISQGVLSIDKKGAIFKKIKSYNLNEAKNFRVYEEPGIDNDFSRRSSGSLWNLASSGTIKFDYGMETVKFGDKLYQAEGEYILERLRNKRLIK